MIYGDWNDFEKIRDAWLQAAIQQGQAMSVKIGEEIEVEFS